VGVQAKGICPSPANNPLVASNPIHPAPGINTSAQACKSVKSASGPDGPSIALISDVNCTKPIFCRAFLHKIVPLFLTEWYNLIDYKRID